VFSVQSSGWRLQGSGFRVWGLGFRFQGVAFVEYKCQPSAPLTHATDGRNTDDISGPARNLDLKKKGVANFL